MKIFNKILLLGMIILNIMTISGIVWEFKFSPNPPDLLPMFCNGLTVLVFDILMIFVYNYYKEEL